MDARLRFWLICALIFAALGVCVIATMDRIQQDLLSQGQLALAAAGIGFYGLEIEGRDAVLHGFVASPEDSAAVRAVVAGIEGVRQVRDETVVERVVVASEPRPSPPSGMPARLRAQVLGRRVFLSGTLPAAAGRELVVAARQRFGAGLSSDGLRLDDGVATPPWLSAAGRLLALLELTAGNARLAIESSSGVLSGQVASAAQAQRLREIAAELPGLELRIELFSPVMPVAGAGGGA